MIFIYSDFQFFVYDFLQVYHEKPTQLKFVLKKDTVQDLRVTFMSPEEASLCYECFWMLSHSLDIVCST